MVSATPVGQPDRDGCAAWLTLVRAPGLGPAACARLLERFTDLPAVLAAPPSVQRDCGLAEATVDYFQKPDEARIEADLAWLGRPDHHLIPWDHALYPPLLREIADPPLVLFVLGDPAVLARLQLAIVGSRNPTRDGHHTAFEFARHLVGAGLVITSGLASGIDGAAHRGALAGGGPTVAVAATGLDRVYPAMHHELAREIASNGALVSEFPPDTRPLPGHFPRRNRIISGLSLATLVVEAAPRSGSLITARLAAEQGRETFAIPGSIHNPLARGCHALIRQGAKLVETAADIIEELGPLAQAANPGPDRPAAAGELAVELDDEYQNLLRCLEYAPLSVDILVERSGLTPDCVSSMLLVLELQGYVSSAAGGRYTRVRDASQ